jgi:hypothetical protein
MALVERLSAPGMLGRATPGGRAAADVAVDDAMREAGLPPPPGRPARSWEYPARGDVPAGRHVAGWVAPAPGGPDEHVLLVARFDARWPSPLNAGPGSDGATGVAACVEVARLLAKGPAPRRAVLVLALDLEAQGLAGAREWVAVPAVPLERCAAVVAADRLGLSLADSYPGLLLVLGTERAKELRDAVASVPAPAAISVRRLGLDLSPLGPPDTLPFEEKSVPSLLLTAGPSRGDATLVDTPDRIDREALAARIAFLADVVRAVANAPARPAWTKEPEPTVAEAEDLLAMLRVAPNGEKEGPALLRKEMAKSLESTIARGKVTRGERASMRVMALQAWDQAMQLPR